MRQSYELQTDRTAICFGQPQGIRGCPVDKAVGVRAAGIQHRVGQEPVPDIRRPAHPQPADAFP